MKTRRTLVLTPAIDGADGISALGRQIVTSLARAVGWANVEVWTLDGRPPPEFPTSMTFWSARGSRARIVSRTMSIAVRGCSELDVIVLHLHLAPLAMLMGSRGARVIDFLIGIEAWTPIRPRERRALEFADRLVSISEFTVREFRRANPALASLPVEICAPGIGVAPGVPPFEDDGFALIVGRLSSKERYKGHDALIDVWPAVLRAVPAAKLVIAGKGDDRRRLEAAVDAGGPGGRGGPVELRHAITFAGRVDDRTLASLYSRCSFFVMPSSREGFGLVYLEAMRAGKPCIAIHGSADEIIRDGTDGLIVDGDSREELTTAIIRLFSNPAERTRMGAAALMHVQQHFSEERFTSRLLRALDVPPPVASKSGQEAFS